MMGGSGAQAGAGSAGPGDMVVSADLAIKGNVKNGRQIDIHGYVEGELEAENLVVHPGGRFFGKLRVNTADIKGELQGDVSVKSLITIRQSGSVSGNVRYGRLAMEEGANLSADVRNIPPEIGGDLMIAVRSGGRARVTTMDLTAHDPDDDATDLVYSVSNPINGYVVLEKSPTTRVESFTQADLEDGSVSFRHDGSQAPTASFDVVVKDASGATSGAAQTVKVAVKAA